MSFLVPAWLAVAAAAAGIVIGLHLLTRAPPRPRVFPTARFVPNAPLRTLARAATPADVLVLLLRLAVVLLAGIALARPVLASRKKPVATIALIDRSPGADSATTRLALTRLSPAADTVLSASDLSSGLVYARRAAAHLSSKADSVGLIIVSPFASGLWDAATPEIRKQWPGRIALAPTPRLHAAASKAEIDVGPDDAITAALDRMGRRSTRGAILVRRLGATRSDRARVAAEGGVLVHWPKLLDPRDTAFAVYSTGVAVVGPLPRATPFRQPPIVLYADGQSAAIERPLGRGCEREVGFSMDAGDIALRSAGLRLVERLLAPCGTEWTQDQYEPLDSTRLAILAGAGPLAAAGALRDDGPKAPSRVFLLLSGAMLIAERLVRRRDRT